MELQSSINSSSLNGSPTVAPTLLRRLLKLTLASGGMLISKATISGYSEILNPIIWESVKNEIIFARVPPGSELNYNVHFAFKVALGEIGHFY
jgi:hypothetical protein